jgi:TonB family protein
MQMSERRGIALLLFVLALMISIAPTAGAQTPTPPLPSGNRIVAQDGDVVVVENDARIKIVRRHEGYLRALFNATERSLELYIAHEGTADGRVDHVQNYRGVEGNWPLGARWEGLATIEEYSMFGQGSLGLGITTPQGLIQLLRPRTDFRDANALAVLSFTSGGTNPGAGTFEEAQRWYSADGSGAYRVGGSVRPPVKLVDVPPVRPEMAVSANVRGIVILEVTIDIDGTVKGARVVRSIPMLDAAALEAVRQWRFEPTVIGGKAVPVIMTVTASF